MTLYDSKMCIFCKECSLPDLCLVVKISKITTTCKVDEEKTTTAHQLPQPRPEKTRTKNHNKNVRTFGKIVAGSVATVGFSSKADRNQYPVSPLSFFSFTVLLAPHTNTVEERRNGHENHDANGGSNGSKHGGSNVGSKLIHGLILSRDPVKSPVTSNFCCFFYYLAQSSGFVVDG